MLADFLRDNALFGASRLIASSASSKTAYGIAHCLPGVETMGLTSPNPSRVRRQRGLLHAQRRLRRAGALPAEGRVLYVDFSGDEQLRARVHAHFGAALVYDCFAGSAQNTRFLRETALPGPATAFFFAPVQSKKRNVDWGPAVFNQRFGDAQRAFFGHVAAAGWLRVTEHRGYAAAGRVITELCTGHADPRAGHVVELA